MRKTLFYAGLSCLLLAASCSRKDFAELNTDPESLQRGDINLKTMFPIATIAMHGNDFEAYYDIHRNLQYWIGAWVPLTGTGGVITRFRTPLSASKYPYRYDNLYFRETIGIMGALIEMRDFIDDLPAAENAKFQHIRAITYIPEAYGAFNLSDIMGSIAFTDAFRARYTTPAILTPKFDTQEALFDSLDKRLKASVAVLKQTFPVTQEVLGLNDMYYHNTDNKEALNWTMAANSLRLRMAMRIYKRKPQAAKAIIDEVLADNVGPINSRAANWVFKAGTATANGGNYALATNISGQKALVDLMYKTGDPRIRNIYQKVQMTLAQFNAAKTAGQIPATEVYQEYRGRYTSPDAVNQADKSYYFGTINGVPLASEIQTGMFNNNLNAGLVNFPLITYADVCFMRAELAARGITAEVAADWYYKGIDASIADYDEWGKDAKVIGYSAMTTGEVTAYKQQPNVVYDPAKGIEQICVQQFINFYRNPYEAWALIKRTGYPSQTGQVLQIEKIMNGGNEVIMPRRFSLFIPPVTDLNYTNRKAALDEMMKDPELGNLSDVTGRVWWDKK